MANTELQDQFFQALRAENLPECDKLLALGADINEITDNGDNLVTLMLSNRSFQSADWLAAKGVDPWLPNKQKFTMYDRAVRQKNRAVINWMWKHPTPLFFEQINELMRQTVNFDDLNQASELLKQGADPYTGAPSAFLIALDQHKLFFIDLCIQQKPPTKEQLIGTRNHFKENAVLMLLKNYFHITHPQGDAVPEATASKIVLANINTLLDIAPELAKEITPEGEGVMPFMAANFSDSLEGRKLLQRMLDLGASVRTHEAPPGDSWRIMPLLSTMLLMEKKQNGINQLNKAELEIQNALQASGDPMEQLQGQKKLAAIKKTKASYTQSLAFTQETFDQLRTHPETPINQPNDNLVTLSACRMNDISVLKTLHAQGLRLTTKPGEDSPLLACANHQMDEKENSKLRLKMLDFLFSNGVDPNSKVLTVVETPILGLALKTSIKKEVDVPFKKILVEALDVDAIALLAKHGADLVDLLSYVDTKLLDANVLELDQKVSIIANILANPPAKEPAESLAELQRQHDQTKQASTDIKNTAQTVFEKMSQYGDLSYREPVTGDNLLHTYVRNASQTAAEFLVQKKPELCDTPNNEGLTPRMLATLKNEAPAHLLNIMNRALPAPDQIVCDLITAAPESSRRTFFNKLMSFPDNQFTSKDTDGNHALLLAAATNQTDLIEAILQKAPQMADEPNQMGETPLLHAILQNNISGGLTLQKHGATLERTLSSGKPFKEVIEGVDADLLRQFKAASKEETLDDTRMQRRNRPGL